MALTASGGCGIVNSQDTMVTGLLLTALASSISTTIGPEGEPSRLIAPLRPFVETVVNSLNNVPEERKTLLRPAVKWAVERLKAGEDADFVFICTANSRRSHLGQVWAQVAATYYGLERIHAYSGGTEVTACNERTIATFKRAGLNVSVAQEGKNPVYLVKFGDKAAPIKSYSKKYSAPENPQKGYAAMMCCAEADRNCPVTVGNDARIPLHYEDPKVSDGTPDEIKTYDERSGQIATEMFYVMSLVQDGIRR